MLHCGRLLQFGSPKDGGVSPLDRGGDNRRERGDKRQLETSRFRSAVDAESSLIFDSDSSTNQLAPGFVKEQRARKEKHSEVDAAKSHAGDSTAWVGVRDAPVACEHNSESAWTVDTPVVVSTSISNPRDWRVTVTLAIELSAREFSTAPPWNAVGSNYGSTGWPNQYPASGHGGYYGSSSGYNAALPWWDGAPSWDGWRQNGWS